MIKSVKRLTFLGLIILLLSNFPHPAAALIDQQKLPSTNGLSDTSSLTDSLSPYKWHTFYKKNSSVDSGYPETKIAVDQDGNTFVVSTSDTAWDGPTNPNCGGINQHNGQQDIFVLKLSPDGTYLCHTFLGGSAGDFGLDLAIDADGYVYIGGYGMNWLGPEKRAPIQSHKGQVAFVVVKLNNNLKYEWHTFEGEYVGNFGGIALDSDKNIYITGTTAEYYLGTNKIAVIRFLSNGIKDWSHTFGDGNAAQGRDIAIDMQNNVFIVGHSYTIWDVESKGEIHKPLHGNDFQSIPIIKLDQDGNYQWHTFYGFHNDGATAVKVDKQGDIILTGISTGYWTGPSDESPLHPYSGGLSLFVLQLDTKLNYLWHTFYGEETAGYDIEIDPMERILITGSSSKTWQGDGLADPLHPFNSNSSNILVLQLNKSGYYLWHTFYGSGTYSSNASDNGSGIALYDGNIYVTGINPFSWLGDFFTEPIRQHSGFSDIFVLNLGSNFVRPFLDLPLDYTNFSREILGNTKHAPSGSPGKVNSWFDHLYPNYGGANDVIKKIYTWDGNFEMSSNDYDNFFSTGKGKWWYDGHNGIDFTGPRNEVVYSAASGTVVKVYDACGVSSNTCEKNSSPDTCGYNANYLGNQVWIDHGNGYLTVYGHLEQGYISVTENKSYPGKYPIGKIGNTGNSCGPHLHFAVYNDQNNDINWSALMQNALDPNEVVDPYGWQPVGKDRDNAGDPWEISTGGVSRWLWKYPPMSSETVGNFGGHFMSRSGYKEVIIPPGVLGSAVNIEIWDRTSLWEPLSNNRSTGQGLLMRISNIDGTPAVSPYQNPIFLSQSFDLPVTVNIKYDEADIRHLNESQLKIVRYNGNNSEWEHLNTVINTTLNQASTETLQAGWFDLQAPLLCPSDLNEPDDYYSGAITILTNGTFYDRLFDSSTDEDWLQFGGLKGGVYTLIVQPSGTAVQPKLELYDSDGVTLLKTFILDATGLPITWTAPESGVYYIRMAQAPGSSNGCKAAYQVKMTLTLYSYLPIVQKK